MGGMGVVGLVGMSPGGTCLGSSQGLRPDPQAGALDREEEEEEEEDAITWKAVRAQGVNLR